MSQFSAKRYGTAGYPSDDAVIELELLWRPIFDKYDRDLDGEIPLEDILQLLHEKNEELQHDIPPSVLEEIVERADWDSNRKLSYAEFKRMVHASDLAEHRPRFLRLVRYAAMAVVPKRQRATVVRRYFEEYSCMPPPLFVITVSLIEVAVFIYYCVTLGEFTATGPVPRDSPLIYNPRRRKEAWRYLTYMLIHVGGFHIFFNLLVQLMLGIPLEMVHKWWRVMLIYAGGVVAGSLGSSLSDPQVFLAGASGGVYALIAGHLATLILNFKEMDFAWVRVLFLTIFGSTDVGVAVYTRYMEEDEDNRVSYAAHLAGATAGLLLGLPLLRNIVVHRWEVITGRVFFAVFVVLILAAVLVNALYQEYFPKSEM
ncbi:rhomboid-related protein 2-like [Dermacentor albipictus]|uniref:rhomboid-related protein 2-like n=1 Tax=Dermacentor albipictus TaxID=60249 RepID=UPI0031FBE7D5